jgi:hypothetical protein
VHKLNFATFNKVGQLMPSANEFSTQVFHAVAEGAFEAAAELL